MKKCCVNCAFCLRTKDYGCSPLRDPSKRFVYSILNEEERKNALKNNFDFLGAEIRNRIAWWAQYNQILDDMKKGMYHEQLDGGRNVLELLQNTSPNSISQDIIYLFGLSQPPEAASDDYLSCWHNLWNLKDKKDQHPSLNQKNECLFFYPYNKKGNKSFEGCEKEREALLAKSRFEITNWLVILGIFVTIMIFVIQSCSNKANYIPQKNTVKPETVDDKVHQPNKNLKNIQSNENNQGKNKNG